MKKTLKNIASLLRAGRPAAIRLAEVRHIAKLVRAAIEVDPPQDELISMVQRVRLLSEPKRVGWAILRAGAVCFRRQKREVLLLPL